MTSSRGSHNVNRVPSLTSDWLFSAGGLSPVRQLVTSSQLSTLTGLTSAAGPRGGGSGGGQVEERNWGDLQKRQDVMTERSKQKLHTSLWTAINSSSGFYWATIMCSALAQQGILVKYRRINNSAMSFYSITVQQTTDFTYTYL